MTMKTSVKQYANRQLLSNDTSIRKTAKVILKNIDTIQCYYCIDTGKMWRERDSMFAQVDGRGKYDIRRCNKCSNGGWVECTHSQNNYTAGGIKLFRMDNITVNDVIEQLKIRFKDKIAEPDPTWNLYQKDHTEQKTKETEININIKELANKVRLSMDILGCNIPGIIEQINDVTIHLSGKLHDRKDKKEIMKKYIIGDKTYYLIYKMTREQKERSAIGNMFKHKKFLYCVDYIVLSPSNPPAHEWCEELLNDKITHKLDTFMKFF